MLYYVYIKLIYYYPFFLKLGSENLYSLEGQIHHKMAFVNTFVPRDRRLILIGHSIGCYIVLELLKRLPHLQVSIQFT